MTDPSTDPVGTVRDFPRWEEPSYSTYSAHCAVRWTDDQDEEYPWLLLGSEGPQRLSHESVEDCRVIGAVPGTPAAERQSTQPECPKDLPGLLLRAADLYEALAEMPTSLRRAADIARLQQARIDRADSAPVPADDEAAVERIARALHRGAWERDIANGTPLEGNDVDSCWSKVGAKYREWYYADAHAALAALRGEQG